MLDQADKLRLIAREKQAENTEFSALSPVSVTVPQLMATSAPYESVTNPVIIPVAKTIEQLSIAHDKTAISSRVIAVTSGKGGVGKTNFTVNIAVALQKAGRRVVILDADFGLANIEVLFGVIPRYNLGHVFSGNMQIQDIITEGPLGIKFLSGGSGLRELANITQEQMTLVIDKFSYIDTISDIILVDTGAGISDSVLNFIRSASETIIITTPEPTSITDAYAIIKASKEEANPKFSIVVNRVDDTKEGIEIFEKISRVTQRFLNMELINLGCIPFDNCVIKSVKSQKPMMLNFPNCDASKAVNKIALQLLEETAANQSLGLKGFMRKLSGIFAGKENL